MMEVAHGPLARTHTTPVHSRTMNNGATNPLLPSDTHAAHFPGFSHASPATGATLFGSVDPPTSSAPPPTSNGGSVMASDSIINQVADSSKSLYQICVKLRQRLSEVPGFEQHLEEMEEDDSADDAVDPVTSMWRCLRKGYPLMTVYNALQPEVSLEVDPGKVAEAKRAKTASFKFVQACLKDLNFPPDECFLIMDLYGDDTTGFVKVTTVVNRVLDILQQRHLLRRPEISDLTTSPEHTQKRTRRDFVVSELVDTERKYVQDLENLQSFKKLVEEKGEVPGDTIHAIFLNLNALLDFQRRFLIRIETMNSLPTEQQNWGQLFTQYHDAFRVYEPYIANQQNADEQATREFDKLQKVGHRITNDRATLSGFIMKPFQRLSKYPLLLKELRDKCDASEALKADITSGINSAASVLERANSAIDKEQRQLAVDELQNRVDDWKGHNILQFGDLLLYGTFTVVKGDGRNDVEREYKIYLFQRILLCCKEQNPNKQKNKVMGMNKPNLDKKGKPKLQLKGRIFMQNVTETLSLQKPGSYTIQIFWKGDPGVENFVIRFTNEETMKKWYNQVLFQQKVFTDSARQSNGRPVGTSDTEFAWSGQVMPDKNPYQQDDEGDDDDEPLLQGAAPHSGASEFSMSRNASNTSLRSRSTTGDSGPPPIMPNGVRVPPPRFPMGFQPPPLTLHTQVPHANSPGEHVGASYFSPTMESPMSSRTSSSSGMYPFPRQATPNNGWPDEHNRFTAPAMGRTASREAPPGANGYQLNGRTVLRPSLPAMAPQSLQQSTLAQNRSRSASSPDIHNRLVQGHRGPNGQMSQPPVPDVPVPPFPPHIAQMKAPVNRSLNNSPTNVHGNLPVRSATQSPGLARDRAPHNHHPAQAAHESMARHDPRAALPSANTTPVPLSAVDARPPTSAPPNESLPTPTQLKVKVSFDNNYVTLVVGMNISYQSLVDRIDAKLSRFTASSIGRGTIRLRYRDEDGDFVTIRSDEDIHIAFSDWKEQQRSQLLQGQLGEIQLYCQGLE